MILRLGGGLTNGQLEVNGGSSPIRLNAATSEDIKIAVFNNTYFQGLIDEVQIYNRALSDTEIMGLAKILSTDPLETARVLLCGTYEKL